LTPRSTSLREVGVRRFNDLTLDFVQDMKATMHARAPNWARLVCRVSRGLNRVDRSQQILRDELLFAFLPPSYRRELTFDAYASTKAYSSGGDFFSQGLFPWEVALLDHPQIPRAGRVLLAAAGGGRELEALLKRGYDVFAFEPVPALFEQAQHVARGSGASVVKASYSDLVTRARGGQGPLDRLKGPFDFCLLGWGSLSHLTELSEVLDVLAALRTLAPHAPVITSFFLRASGVAPSVGGARRLRRLLRRVFAVAGGRPVHPGLQFYLDAGFVRPLLREELYDLCERTGYEVAYFTEVDYPHALLLPKAGSPDARAGDC
jgi:hypothetical protein